MTIFLADIIIWVIKIGLFSLGTVFFLLSVLCLKNAYESFDECEFLKGFLGYVALCFLSGVTFIYLFTTEIRYVP